jgi:hypothetical protein
MWAADTVAQVDQDAARWLRQYHPDLSDQAVGVVANDFSFIWKVSWAHD